MGEIPEHWTTMPLKAIASGSGEAFIDGDWIESRHLADSGVRYITTGNVGVGVYKEQGSGYISDETFTELGCTAVQPGDVLISRLNAPIGRACLAPDLGVRVVTSVDNVIVRSSPLIDRRWLVFRLSSPDYLHEAGTIASGATMQRISRSELGSMRLAFPPPNEQQAIATFLHHETAKIDGLIAEQEKLIALLAEKRQATISHAVTRGLNPQAPMKDSGVPWLGEVPAHWGVRALRRVIAGIEQGWSPECYAREAEATEWGVLKAGCLNGGVFRPSENKALPPDLSPEPKYEVRAGDVLMSRASGSPELVGSTALVTTTRPGLMLSDKIFRMHLQEAVTPRYFVAAMGSLVLRAQIENALSGGNGMANNLPQSSLLAFAITVPPQDEQQEIVDFIDGEVSRLGNLRVEAELAIALLRERRSALIAAAVTGQIDVRGFTAA